MTYKTSDRIIENLQQIIRYYEFIRFQSTLVKTKILSEINRLKIENENLKQLPEYSDYKIIYL
jgi:hypothetical protein